MSDADTLTALNSSFDSDTSGRTLGTDIGLLVLRLGVGAIMVGHGAQKLFGWFEGPGRDATKAMVAQAGYPSEDIMSWVLGLSELLGGLGLILGFLTPLAGAAVIGVLINAIALKWGFEWEGPIAQGGGGIELEFLLAAAAAGLALTGAGRLSVDAGVPGLKANRLGFGVAGVVFGILAAATVLFLRTT
jgi:putative oxidoreductase